MKIERIFNNNPSPHYEEWIILEDEEIPTLEEIDKERQKLRGEK